MGCVQMLKYKATKVSQVSSGSTSVFQFVNEPIFKVRGGNQTQEVCSSEGFGGIEDIYLISRVQKMSPQDTEQKDCAADSV